MTFFYNGHERLRFIFDTPNQFGVFLNFIIFLSLAIAFWLFRNDKKKTGTIIVLLGTIPAVVLMMMTYSRGAMVGTVAGALLLSATLEKKLRIRVIAIGCIIAVIILLVIPEAINRAVRIFHFSDLAIANRFTLWQGGTEICADYWLFGTPVDIGCLYSAMYQPIDMNTSYTTFVNDYLTIGANYGLIVLFGYVMIFAFCMYSAYHIYNKKHDTFILGCGAGVAAYTIAAFFSTFYNNTILFTILSATVIYILIRVFRFRHEFSFRTAFYLAGTVAGGLVGFVFLCGLWFSRENPVKSQYIRTSEANFWQISPRNITPDRVILYLANDEVSDFTYDFKCLLRSIAEKGNVILAGTFVSQPGQLFQAMKHFLENGKNHDPITVLILGAFDAKSFFNESSINNVSSLIIINQPENFEIPQDITIPILLTGEVPNHNFKWRKNIFTRSVSFSRYERSLLRELIILFQASTLSEESFVSNNHLEYKK